MKENRDRDECQSHDDQRGDDRGVGARIDFGDLLGDEPVERPGEQPTADAMVVCGIQRTNPTTNPSTMMSPEEQIARGDSAQFRKERDEAEAVGAQIGRQPERGEEGATDDRQEDPGHDQSMIAAARTSEPAIEADAQALLDLPAEVGGLKDEPHRVVRNRHQQQRAGKGRGNARRGAA